MSVSDPQKRSDESSTLALLGKKYVDYKVRSHASEDFFGRHAAQSFCPLSLLIGIWRSCISQVASLTVGNVEGYPVGETNVRRRFRDFVALADRLALSQRGCADTAGGRGCRASMP